MVGGGVSTYECSEAHKHSAHNNLFFLPQTNLEENIETYMYSLLLKKERKKKVGKLLSTS